MFQALLLKLFKGQVAKKKDGAMIIALSDTNAPGDYTVSNVAASPLKLYNILRLACVDHVKLSAGQVVKD